MARSEPIKARCGTRSEEHTSELQSRVDLVCRLLLEKKKADFARGQLAAFTGLRTLVNFDFEFFGVDKVVGGDAKSRGVHFFVNVCRTRDVYILSLLDALPI